MRLLFSLFIASLLVSCEKAVIDEDVEQKEQNANLILTVASLEQAPFAEAIGYLASAKTVRLNFAVYDSSGKRIKQVNQQSGAADFGRVSYQLEPGTYRIVALAHSSSGNPTMTDPAKILFKNSQGFTDTFLYSEEIELDDHPLSLNLSLTRITALCRFQITDNYPSEVCRMQFQYKGGSGAFNAKTGLGCVNSTQTVSFDVRQGQKVFDLYTFLHHAEDDIHLKVTALDANDQVVHEREFDIPMEQKMMTLVKRSFFKESDDDTDSDTDEDTTTNGSWLEPYVIYF